MFVLLRFFTGIKRYFNAKDIPPERRMRHYINRAIPIVLVLVAVVIGLVISSTVRSPDSDRGNITNISVEFDRTEGATFYNMTQVGDVALADLSFMYMRGRCAPVTSSMAYLETFLSDHNYSIVAQGENGYGDAVTLWCITVEEYNFGSEASWLKEQYVDLLKQIIDEIPVRKKTLVDGMQSVDGMRPNKSPLRDLLGGKDTSSEILDKFLQTHRADTCKDHVVLDLARLEFEDNVIYPAGEAVMSRCKNQLSADLDGQTGLTYAYIQVKNAEAILAE